MAPILFHRQLQPIPLDAISAALCDAKADPQSSAKELQGELPEHPAPFTLIPVQEFAPSPPVSTSQKSQPYLGWHWSFLLLGLTTLAGAAIIARTLPRERRPLPTHPHPGHVAQLRSMLRHFRNPRLLATFTVGFGMLFALVSTLTYVSFYLAAPPFHLSTAALSYLFAIYLIGLMVTPAGGYLITRIGLRYDIVLAIALCLLGECLTLVHSLPVIIFGGLALVCTGVFLAQSAAASFLRIAAPEGGRVSAAGLYLSCYYLGGTVGGVLPAVAWEIGKWPTCVALTSSVLFAIVFVGWTGFQAPHPPRTILE